MVTSGEIVIEGVNGITRVLQYQMHNKMLEHPELTLVCEISNPDVAKIFADAMRIFHVVQKQKKKSICLFSGYSSKIVVEKKLEYYLLHIKLIAGSILLDMKEKYRSYQEVSMTHTEIIEKATKEAKDIYLYCKTDQDHAIGKPYIQYDETDWEFIKRIASRINEPVFADETEKFPKVFVGKNSAVNKDYILVSSVYEEGIDTRYYEMGSLACNRKKTDYYYYRISTTDILYIGQKVKFLNHEMYVYEKKAFLDKDIISYSYKLVFAPYMWVPAVYNEYFVGGTVLGTIQNTESETMELSLHLQDEKKTQTYYAYDWKPEVGNLMYCMPQKGTEVSLYFPDHDEQNAIAVNCIRRDRTYSSGNNDLIFDASTKTFVTETGKTLVLAPEAMHLCTQGKSEDVVAQLSMVDDVCTILSSLKDITITSEAGIGIDSPYIDLIAANRISLMKKTELENGVVTASVDISAALVNMIGQDKILFIMKGRFHDRDFKLILDVPEVGKANVRALARNIGIEVAVTIGIAALCVFALPIALTAVGVATATASTMAMGAATGAIVTGVFALGEQTYQDCQKGNATSGQDTFIRSLTVSTAGAIEGAITAPFSEMKMIAYKSDQFWKQTAKNMIKKLTVSEAGSMVTSTGQILVDVNKGQFSWDKAGQTYLNNAKATAITTGLLFNKEVQKDPTAVAENIMGKFKKTEVYKKYGNFIEVGKADAKLMTKQAEYKMKKKVTKKQIERLTDDIVDQQAKMTAQLAKIGEQKTVQSELKNKIGQQEGNVKKLKGAFKHLKRQMRYDQGKYSTMQQSIQNMEKKKGYKELYIEELKKAAKNAKWSSYGLRWKTVMLKSACGVYNKGTKKIEKKLENKIIKEYDL